MDSPIHNILDKQVQFLIIVKLFLSGEVAFEVDGAAIRMIPAWGIQGDAPNIN